MSKKQTTPQSDDSTLTIEHANTALGEAMADFKSAAETIDAYIAMLQHHGFFALEQELILDEIGDKKLVLTSYGELKIKSPGLTPNPVTEQYDPLYDPISSIKAVSRYNVRNCVMSIHSAINKLSPIARQKREESREGIEVLKAEPLPSKSLPPPK